MGSRTRSTAAPNRRVHMRHGCVIHDHVRFPGAISSRPPLGAARPGHIVLCGRRLYFGLANGQWGFVPLRVDAACDGADKPEGRNNERDESAAHEGRDGADEESADGFSRVRCASPAVIDYDPSWDDESCDASRPRLDCGTLVRRNGLLYRTLRSIARWEFAALSLCPSRNNGLELI